MWRVIQVLGILALLLYSDARPKKYRGMSSKKPADTQATPGRLSNDVTPTKYVLDLTVTEDDIKNGNFTGTVAIEILVAAANNDLRSFPIHAKDLQINHITLDGFDGTVTYAGPDPSNDFLTITSDSNIKNGIYSLVITYGGMLSETDMEGFYKSTYKENGETKYLATTQFEEFGARRAFPCFDEPAMKAVFAISVTYSDGYSVISNMSPQDAETAAGTGLKKITFNDTPRMSTYAVAFVVSQLSCPTTPSESTTIITCARSGTEDTMSFAQNVTIEVLANMEDFTGISFASLGLDKLTEAAIPDFVLGGMENWGLVTYREPALLWDEDHSSTFYQKKVLGLITHELSHQWFGDLVTLNWWSDIFLNEGFATFFQYYAAPNSIRDFEMPKQFVIEQLQPALLSDSVNTSLPLHLDTTDQDLIENRFDDISYNKGGAILRMVQNWVGEHTFQDALQDYIQKSRQPNTATVNNLWNSFDDHVSENFILGSVTFSNAMYSWTNKAGYPLLDAKFVPDDNYPSILVTQKRFLISGTDEEHTKWFVPISYATGNVANPANTRVYEDILTPDNDFELTIDESYWIILNHQQIGYYRVNYDDHLLERISNALSGNLDVIDEINRSHLIDDQFNLARAGIKSYCDFLKFTSFLNEDGSYYSWSSAFNGFSYLLKYTIEPNIREDLTSLIANRMDALSKTFKFDVKAADSPPRDYHSLEEILGLTWACDLGYGSCINSAKENFHSYTQDDTFRPDPDYEAIVYCYGLRNSDNPEEDYNFLWNKYISSNLGHEQLTILDALGCINNSTYRIDYLQKALTSDVRIQDATYVFSSVYTKNPEGPEEVLDFLTKNYEKFSPHFGEQNPLGSVLYGLADASTTQAVVDKFADFIKISGLDEEIKAQANEAMTAAINNLETVKKVQKQVEDYFHPQPENNNSSCLRNNFVSLILVAVLILRSN